MKLAFRSPEGGLPGIYRIALLLTAFAVMVGWFTLWSLLEHPCSPSLSEGDSGGSLLVWRSRS